MRRLAATTAGLLALTALTRPSPADEPVYEGKSPGAWVAQLKDRNAKVGTEEAEALGKLGPHVKAAVDPLLGALKDPDQYVQIAAQALTRQRGRGDGGDGVAPVSRWRAQPASGTMRHGDPPSLRSQLP